MTISRAYEVVCTGGPNGTINEDLQGYLDRKFRQIWAKICQKPSYVMSEGEQWLFRYTLRRHQYALNDPRAVRAIEIYRRRNERRRVLSQL